MCSPLLALLRKVDDALDSQVDAATFGLSDDELTEALVLAHQVVSRGQEMELRIARQTATRDRDVKTAWVRQTRQSPHASAVRLQLAAALETREPLRRAMAAGEVCEAQARVVVDALDRLPVDQLSAELLDQAQTHLIGLCAQHHPDELRVLGRRLLQTIAPEIAEAHEAKQVEDEYRRAIAKRRLELWDRGDGTFSVKGVLPSMHGHILDKLLKAWESPKHCRATDRSDTVEDGERLDAAQRRARAFCEFLERLPVDAVPYSGGVSARVVVDIDLDDLTARMSEAGIATLDGTVDIPAWEARRMACEAGLVPTVLNGRSEPLDLGRSKRFHNEPQRIAIFARDRTCRADGCDWPASMGHVHHPIPWSAGGSTDLTGMSLCPHHHARAHDPTYEMTMSKNGRVVFLRR